MKRTLLLKRVILYSKRRRKREKEEESYAVPFLKVQSLPKTRILQVEEKQKDVDTEVDFNLFFVYLLFYNLHYLRGSLLNLLFKLFNKGIVRQPSVFLKHRKRSNDVVEIFHNTTLKNSNSGVSGKHFKFDRETKYAKNPHFTEINHHKTQEKSCSERANYEHQSCSKETQQSRHLQALDNPNKSG